MFIKKKAINYMRFLGDFMPKPPEKRPGPTSPGAGKPSNGKQSGKGADRFIGRRVIKDVDPAELERLEAKRREQAALVRAEEAKMAGIGATHQEFAAMCQKFGLKPATAFEKGWNILRRSQNPKLRGLENAVERQLLQHIQQKRTIEEELHIESHLIASAITKAVNHRLMQPDELK